MNGLDTKKNTRIIFNKDKSCIPNLNILNIKKDLLRTMVDQTQQA